MTDATDTAPRRLEIRKYPNRRYYDSTRSRHVTLEEIHALIRDGCEVQVVDSRSGQDITAKVLAQILIELDPPKLGVFPAPLLHRLLRSNEKLVTEFTQKYFSQAVMSFLDSQKNWEQYVRQAMGLHTSAPTVADLTRMMWGPLNPGLWGGGAKPAAGPAAAAGEAAAPTAASGASAPPPAPDPAAGAEEDARELRQLDALRREVAELRQRRVKRKIPARHRG